jgi:PPOX class probable F420-dependent enzyme
MRRHDDPRRLVPRLPELRQHQRLQLTTGPVVATRMTDEQVRAFLSAGTRTGKLAWVGASGQPHVVPIWFVVDDTANELEVVFNTGGESAKGRALRRDPRVSLVVDEEVPPYAFVKLTGTVSISEEPGDLLRWATRIGGRYMGAGRAEEFGRRNGEPGELLVRLRPTTVIALDGIAD